MATIGSSAPSQNTINYDALLTTTLMAYRKTMVDNIFAMTAFLSLLRQKGAVQTQNGGERVALPLMYGKNETVKTVGGYDLIDTTPQDGMTTAFYEWAEIAGSISISRREERQNSGEGRIIDLLGSKIKQAEMSMSEKLNKDLVLGTVSGATFVPEQATGGLYGLLPLGYFMRKLNATDPTVGGNVGNIAGATYDWWRSKTADIGSNGTQTGNAYALNATTYAGLKAALYRMYNHLTRGTGGPPDICLMDQISFETYHNSLEGQIRYADTEQAANFGFETLKLRRAQAIWDEWVPDVYTGTAAITKGTAFFLNTNFYKLIIDSQTDIVTTPFVEPENQTAKTAKILFMGQAAVSNMHKMGVCYDILQTIVA